MNDKTTGWLHLLDIERRDAVLAAMREVREKSDRLLEEHRVLSPPSGTIPVGGSHIDSFFVGNALAELLGGLSKGMTPFDAAALAEAAGRDSVEKWNRHRGNDYQSHRWVHTADVWIWKAAGEIAKAAEGRA